MAYTRDGHHIPGSPRDPRTGMSTASRPATCGDFETCRSCIGDLVEYTISQMFKGRHGPSQQESPLVQYFDAHAIVTQGIPRSDEPVFRAYQIMARGIDAILPNGPEKTTALRKLLESRDAAYRAHWPPLETTEKDT